MRTKHELWAVVACVLLAACQGGPHTLYGPPVVHHPRESAIDVEHYALDIELHPERREISATCTVRLHPRDQSLGHVELDFEGLEVTSVHDGDGRSLEFAHASGVLAVTLAEELAPGDFVELVVEYRGVPANGLWFCADRDGVPTQVYTQGECENAHWWFPCWDYPSDRATSEVRVTMPGTWVAVAAGERIDLVEHDGLRTEHWRMNTPHPTYLVTLVAGELEVHEEQWDGTPLLYLSRPEYASWMGAAFDETDDALEFMSDLTGLRYPYPKYSQACVDNFPFGGMENISATTVTEWTLKDERGIRDDPSFGLVVHEAAHQWFGDLLTCNDWSHIWLNEGFATYMTLLYCERTRGRDEFLARLVDMQLQYIEGDVASRRGIVHDKYKDPFDLFFGGHTYQGGATRLHLLRHVLGDDAFFRGIRRYVGEHQGLGVVTEDLRRSLEEESGASLAEFFDQWIYGPGFPELRVVWRFDESARQVEVSVLQVQEAKDGVPAVFRIPVDIEVRTAEGATLHRVELAERKQRFRFPVDSEPTWVRFDKYSAIPKLIDTRKTKQEWIAIAAGDDDVNGRRMAVAVLAHLAAETVDFKESELLADIVIERLAADAHASVRRDAATALGGVPAPGVRAALERAAATDPDTAVRVAALFALTERGDEAGLAAFGREQFEAGYSWATMGAAATLVCSADPSAFGWIEERLEIESPHGVLRAKLLEAAATLRGEDRVLPLLLREVRDPEAPDLARIAAARMLGHVGKGLGEARDVLLDLLDSPDFKLREAALEGLYELDDPVANYRLRAYHEETPFSLERRAIEKILRRTAG